jgi:hypothetical protein
MFKKAMCIVFAAQFLLASLIFPLGDFALMSDIPQMYRNYAKVACKEELGIIDFIGDYLLGGRQLLGHNLHDKIPETGNNVQFQHRAMCLDVIFNPLPSTILMIYVYSNSPKVYYSTFQTSGHIDKVFRPPLT